MLSVYVGVCCQCMLVYVVSVCWCMLVYVVSVCWCMLSVSIIMLCLCFITSTISVSSWRLFTTYTQTSDDDYVPSRMWNDLLNLDKKTPSTKSENKLKFLKCSWRPWIRKSLSSSLFMKRKVDSIKPLDWSL